MEPFEEDTTAGAPRMTKKEREAAELDQLADAFSRKTTTRTGGTTQPAIRSRGGRGAPRGSGFVPMQPASLQQQQGRTPQSAQRGGGGSTPTMRGGSGGSSGRGGRGVVTGGGKRVWLEGLKNWSVQH